eukprot:10311794-Alexandrium_andersonii.AAC.1
MGNYSKPFYSMQGIIAGCSHATTLLRVVLFRLVSRVDSMYRSVLLRVLVDDTSIQWSGNKIAADTQLAHATKAMLHGFGDLMLVPSPGKSGVVASSAKVSRVLRGPLAKIGIG